MTQRMAPCKGQPMGLKRMSSYTPVFKHLVPSWWCCLVALLGAGLGAEKPFAIPSALSVSVVQDVHFHHSVPAAMPPNHNRLLSFELEPK